MPPARRRAIRGGTGTPAPICWKARLRRKGISYAIATSRKNFAANRAAFDGAIFERRLRRPVAGPTPIFITGMPRSSITLTEQVLSSHLLVEGLGELRLITDLALDVSDWSETAGDFPDALAVLGEDDLARATALYMERLPRLGAEPFVGDKMPSKFLLSRSNRTVLPPCSHHTLSPRCPGYLPLLLRHGFQRGPGMEFRSRQDRRLLRLLS